MKLLPAVFAFSFVFITHAHALVPIDVTYTGHAVTRPNDSFSYVHNGLLSVGLGGEPFNQYIVERAFQFTVDNPSHVEYLSVNATAYPSIFSEVFHPAQTMDVHFKVFDGSVPFGPDSHPRPDFSNLVASSYYQFETGGGINSKEYNGLQLPFNASLQPGKDYWIYAADPDYSGATLKYDTAFVGRVAVPEPSTWALIILGLVMAFPLFRKRALAKVARRK